MLMIEAAIRGGAVMLLLLEAALLWRGTRQAVGSGFGALFAVSVATYLVASAPGLAEPGAWWLVPIRLVSNGTPALLWLCARASFDDGFVASPRDAIPWLGVVALAAVCIFDLGGPWAHRLLEVLQLLLIALAMREAVVGRAADLVEERRRFRVVFVTGAAIYAGVCVVLEIVTAGPPVPPWSMVNAAGIAAFAFVAILALVMIAVRASAVPAASRPSRPQDLGRPPSLPIDEAQAAQLARLRRVMEEERAYREEGLSIAMLSSRLDLPEYRLRRLINQCLGHRNFSSFVNGYRLADAVAALADPSQAAVPVITIALDAGFQSLGPFNRAFKAFTGLTPTDYRRRRLGGAGEEPVGSPIPEIGKVG